MGAQTRKSKRVTLNDVAQEAGVSIQTVSHVMTGNPTVKLPESTREKVRKAAEKVGYQPNRHAQAIRSGRTNVIGIWMPVDRPIVSYLRMLHVISLEAKKSGYELMIVPLDRESGLSENAVAPNMWPVDGILAMDSGSAVERYREVHQNDATPVVVIGYEEVSNGDSVSWSLVESVRDSVASLIERGCKRVVYVTMDWQVRDFPRERRRQGYREALEKFGLKEDIVEVKVESRLGAREAMDAYIAKHGVPDAIFGMTDVLAAGAARAVLMRGVSIPGECKVLGYGWHPDSEDFDVPISTLRSPIEKVIPEAWRLLLDRIENPNQPHRLVEMPMEFIERESTR